MNITKSIRDLQMMNRKNNRTTLFMMPSLCLSPSKYMKIDIRRWNSAFEVFLFFGFQDIYLRDRGYMEKYDENNLIMLFTPSLDAFKKWDRFRDVYLTEPGYVLEYDLDVLAICIEFAIHPKYKGLKEIFERGEYSKMLPIAKREYFVNNQGEKSREYSIVTKSSELRRKIETELDVILDDDAELDSPPNPDEEELDWELLKDKIRK